MKAHQSQHWIKKALLASLIATVSLIYIIAEATHGQTGNGAPNGSHYTLNVIGVSNPKKADMKDSSRHVIFVDLSGKTKIELSEGDDFSVLDGNGTDHDGAAFELPNPDANDDGITTYSVFARALGTPGGSANITTCAMAPGPDKVLGTEDDIEECNTGELIVGLTRNNGKPIFQNVSKELLYIWEVDLYGDGSVILKRVPLFDDSLEGYFWDYDNNGLRIAQLRFYPCSTDVGDEVGDEINDDACFGGVH